MLTPEQIRQVKGMGCLQDKRYEDVFNVRVLTKNGRLTTDTARIILDAADKFGSGKIAMTTRLTIEIQGVKYDNIPGLIEFLAQHGLEPGGTGFVHAMGQDVPITWTPAGLGGDFADGTVTAGGLEFAAGEGKLVLTWSRELPEEYSNDLPPEHYIANMED